MRGRSKFQKKRQFRKRKAAKKNVARRLKTTNQGYFNVNRRLPFMSIQSSNTLGAVSVTDPTGTCVTTGLPTAVPGGLSGLYDIPFSLVYRLDQLQNVTEFTNLFDHYKINGVKVDLKCFSNSSTVTGVGNSWIEYWTDHDDGTPLSAVAAREVMGVKTAYYSSSKQMVRMFVKPKPIADLETSAGSAPAAIGFKGWLNAADPQIPHFSIKGIIHNAYISGTPGQNQFQIESTMNLSLKGVQ